MSYLDIVYQNYREEVEKVAKEVYNVEDVQWSKPPFFGQRLPLAKKTFEGMSEAQKAEVMIKLKKVQEQGFEPEMQRKYVPVWCAAGTFNDRV